jgi:AmmeMemoRadiSam system protein B
LYYPRDAEGLRSALQSLLGHDAPTVPRLPKALVVPHAGYAYSGVVAAAAFRLLNGPAAAGIRHVVLLGPSHRVRMHGLAMPTYASFETPLGPVRVNSQARLRLRELGLAGVADAPHALEHALEVQLPFLQTLLGEFDLLPLAVGMAPPEQVARTLEAVWGGAETLVVISTDLSHYHTHAEAQTLDQQTARLILERRSDLSETQACGADSLNGLMEVARHRALRVELIDRRTSGDTAGDNQRVVGYGSFALYEPA